MDNGNIGTCAPYEHISTLRIQNISDSCACKPSNAPTLFFDWHYGLQSEKGNADFWQVLEAKKDKRHPRFCQPSTTQTSTKHRSSTSMRFPSSRGESWFDTPQPKRCWLLQFPMAFNTITNSWERELMLGSSYAVPQCQEPRVPSTRIPNNPTNHENATSCLNNYPAEALRRTSWHDYRNSKAALKKPHLQTGCWPNRQAPIITKSRLQTGC